MEDPDPDAAAARIATYAGLIVATAFVAGAARYGMRELLNGMSRRIECDLRNDFFVHLLRLDATFYGRTRTGDLMSRATNDTLAVRMAVGPAVMYTANTIVGFVFSLSLMIWISPRLTLLSTFVQENLTGVRIVRAYTQEAEQARQFDVYNEEYRRKNMSLVLSAGAFHPVLMLISGIALVLATWLGALEVVAGRMTKGDFVAYGFYW